MTTEKDVRVTVRMPAETKQAMKKFCTKNDMSMSQLVRKAWQIFKDSGKDV
jgi:hypothetical protein